MGSKHSDTKVKNIENTDTEGLKKGKPNYQDPNYKGEPVDDKLSEGPIEKRHCTDCLCCLLFVAFAIAWFICGFYGFAHGDPYLLTYPYDSDTHQCGRPDTVAEDYPYLYYPFPMSGYLGYRSCLKHCPKNYTGPVECLPNSKLTDCEFRFEDVSSTPDSDYGYIHGIYPSKGYLSRFCLPDGEKTQWVRNAYNEVSDSISATVLSEWFSDVLTTWQVIGIVAAAALVLGFIYLFVLRYFIGVIVWLSILGTFCGLLVLAIFLQWAGNNMYDDNNDSKTQDTIKICAYILYGICGIFLIYILFMCNRIRLAIAIMKAATVFLKDVWLALLIPIVMYIVIIATYIYWICAVLFLYSDGDLRKSTNESNPIPKVDWDATVQKAFYYEFWGILWMNAFLIALSQFILASTVCIWYFSCNSESGAQRPISRSIYRAFRYHLGSLAFGALILAIVWTIKYLLMYFSHQVKKAGGTQNKIISWLLKCLACYVACFERFIKFINKNAFIQVALQSTSFCKSAREAFFLILRNAGRFLTLGTIGGVFILLGKWTITICATFIGYMIITHASKWKDDIYSPVFPTIVFLLCSYLIASIFMSVYGMACDTILQCFLVDEELGKKSDRPPAHSPQVLQDFLNRERQRPEKKSCCC